MLDQHIARSTLCRKTRQAIAYALWNTPVSEVEPSLDIYFRYYTKQCELIALHDGGSHVIVRTHNDIIRIAQLLRESRTRDEIAGLILLPDTPSDESHRDLSIDLAARLLLMIEFGNLPYAYSGFKQLEWAKGSLKDFITQRFIQEPELGHENIKFEKGFDALHLEKIAGIKIIWTSNLADHLRLMNDDKALAIFHHASFLKRQQSDYTMFPKVLIEETLNTLALLFPKWDKDTRLWYQREASISGLDPYLIEIGRLNADKRQIEGFHFWHDRLVMLKQIFDEARPSTLSQWWHDRRNGVQWYTFWVAAVVLVLTVFFGLVQSIEGALQVYKAYNP